MWGTSYVGSRNRINPSPDVLLDSLKRTINIALPHPSRIMPSTDKFEWLVIVPDNAGVLETRMKLRPFAPFPLDATSSPLIFSTRAHIEGVKSDVESGFWKMGGPMFFLSLLE